MYDVKLPNFTFYGGLEDKGTIFFFFNSEILLKKSPTSYDILEELE